MYFKQTTFWLHFCKRKYLYFVEISLKYQFTQFTDLHMHHHTLARNELTCPDHRLFHAASPAGVSLHYLIYAAPQPCDDRLGHGKPKILSSTKSNQWWCTIPRKFIITRGQITNKHATQYYGNHLMLNVGSHSFMISPLIRFYMVLKWGPGWTFTEDIIHRWSIACLDQTLHA